MSASRLRRLLDKEHEFQVWDMRYVHDTFQDLECEASEAVLRAPLGSSKHVNHNFQSMWTLH